MLLLGLVALASAQTVRELFETDPDFRIYAVQFAVVETPQNVLRCVGAPSEIAGIPSEKVLLPVGQQLRIVRCAPAACDGITFEIDIDTALLRLLDQLRMRGHRVLVRSSGRLITAGGAVYPLTNQWDEESKDDTYSLGLGFRYGFGRATLEASYRRILRLKARL